MSKDLFFELQREEVEYQNYIELSYMRDLIVPDGTKLSSEQETILNQLKMSENGNTGTKRITSTIN